MQAKDGKRIKSVSYAKYGYIFSIPFILTFSSFFSLYPTLFTAVIGFTDFKGRRHARPFIFSKDPFANFIRRAQ